MEAKIEAFEEETKSLKEEKENAAHSHQEYRDHEEKEKEEAAHHAKEIESRIE